MSGDAISRLIYITNTSVDGFMEDEAGSFDWTAPTDELFRFITDLVRPIGTYLYGRRLYDAMAVWETDRSLAARSAAAADFADVWQAADKIVYSTTLTAASTANTRIEPEFDVDAVRFLKARATRDMSIGGADIARQALSAGILDEYHLLVRPVIVGGGKPALPVSANAYLELLEHLRLEGGVIYLRYRVTL